MQSSKKIKKGQIEDFISDSTQTELDLKLQKDFSTLTSVTLPLVDTDLFAVVRGGVAYKIQKSDLSVQIYKTINTNTSLDNSYHNTVVWVTATCNITIPSGLRSDFNCTFRTLTGATATFLTSGTTINAESDGDVQAEKSMSYLAQYTTNNYILSGGGLS